MWSKVAKVCIKSRFQYYFAIFDHIWPWKTEFQLSAKTNFFSRLGHYMWLLWVKKSAWKLNCNLFFRAKYGQKKPNFFQKFHVCQFWVTMEVSRDLFFDAKWTPEPLATSGNLVWSIMDDHGTSRKDLRFEVRVIPIVNWDFFKKYVKTPHVQSHFSRDFH